jgi:hypothetical protein
MTGNGQERTQKPIETAQFSLSTAENMLAEIDNTITDSVFSDYSDLP